jgi:hypothetical protein
MAQQLTPRSLYRTVTEELILPTLLFAALGGMTWAVRGCSGFGGSAGCIFAGVMWGAAWWYLAYDPSGRNPRRYSSAWIVLAVTVGVGFSGARGWMQWPSFFEGRLQTNYGKGEFLPISRTYGFAWLFIAGMPWAGIGACLLAWCGSLRETRIWHWLLRIALGLAGGFAARYLFDSDPQLFLPLYSSIEDRYKDLETNPNLGRLINDSRSAIFHLGLYLGLWLYEIVRREWKNCVLILTVGIVNGLGWAALQNWKWAPEVWPGATFNWWRCWESSGGISIGVAYGVAWFLTNRDMSPREQELIASRRALAGPNFEWLLIYFLLVGGLGLFFRFQMGGWGNLYFAVLYLFGCGYYFVNRGRSLADPAHATGSTPPRSALTIEWGALLITAVLIAGPYVAAANAEESSASSRWMFATLSYAAALALGGLWYFLRRETFEAERARTTPAAGDANLERFVLYAGLLLGLGLSLRNGLKGWFNIYKGDEDVWSAVLWQILGPIYLMILISIVAWILLRPRRPDARANLFPHAYALLWLVLIVQNVIAQLITGPPHQWNEMAFSIYYVLLFAITAVIVIHYRTLKTLRTSIDLSGSDNL